ncbi:helix-turn-helix domain-containing protein [Pseudoduganella namucuonensis]|uniref:Transcriptional regulator, AraC family n=1 Tax=Pseudoduganella namucuonensis TaxID=1035707 RepID=A0A1I7JDD4_9BURK|nr:AraC family transcriptional regulator [Pseudoduganella namucuonensis]SFU83187.1 transcriptional regulator, AraC family [Pseudoduganella namucuonensis]
MPELKVQAPTLISPALARATNASSQGRYWQGVDVDWHDWKSGGRASSPALDHDVIAMRTSGMVRLTQVRDGKTHTAIALPGNVTLHPRGMESNWSWDQPGAIAIVRIPPALLADAAESTLKSPPLTMELQNCFGRKDPFIERIIALFLDELHAPPHPAQAYTTEALSVALARHMASRFNAPRPPAEAGPLDLHARAVQRVKDYIQENLHQAITLDALASLANVSRFHFARMFRHSTGVSAMAYLERARMARAQELIRTGGLSMSLVAIGVGYEDQSYFTRRFRLRVGMTPAAYARESGAARRIPV